jgi:hypothetical protein
VGLVLAAAMAFLIPKQYRSATQLMPPENSPSSSMLAAAVLGSNASASPLSGLVGLRTTGALYVSVLDSRTIGDRLVERFELRRVYRVRRLESAREQERSCGPPGMALRPWAAEPVVAKACP